MIELFVLFTASTALAAVLAIIGIWSHRKLTAKVFALVATALFIPTVYLTYGDLLSRPKPASLEWWHRDAPEATVVGSQLREGEAIFVWLELPEASEPRAYKLPWQQELAKQLYGAQRQAEARGTQVKMRRPFDNLTDQIEPMFYAQPQPPLPPKHVERETEQRFRHSSAPSRGTSQTSGS